MRPSFFKLLIAVGSSVFSNAFCLKPRRSTHTLSPAQIRRVDTTRKVSSSLLSAQQRNNDIDKSSLRERIINKQIVDMVVSGEDFNRKRNERILNQGDILSVIGGKSSTIEMNLLGQGYIGPDDDTSLQSSCLFLTPTITYDEDNDDASMTSNDLREKTFKCIPVPLPSSKSKSMLKLLSFACNKKPISKSLCLVLSPILINRDGSLYDNLPWESWTIDPLEKNRDAAGNNINKKYHLGKRDAYNRFMGKDWYGHSLSIGNLAARAKYMLEYDDDELTKENDDEDNVVIDENAAKILAKRVLELEIKETKMAVAAVEEQLAILRVDLGSTSIDSLPDDVLIKNFDALQNAIEAVQNARSSLEEREDALRNLSEHDENTESNSEIVSLLSMIIDSQKSDAPYRGAIGYKPTIDSKQEMFKKSILPYSSPFELMLEIINEQLYADVIGCVIENTSLFNGSVVLGGALVLQRRTVKKEVNIDGERIEINDTENTLGNDELIGGDVIIVECDCDEAIGMAITCGLTVCIEHTIWDQAQVSCRMLSKKESGDDTNNIPPLVKSIDSNIILKRQGGGEQSQGIPIQVPRAPRDEFESLFTPSQTQNVFNTDNPVTSLSQFDEMSVQVKAQLLLSLESFKGKLPRPRTLRQSTQNYDGSVKQNPLDRMLLPLIDESVRRQFLIREAKLKGDEARVKLLQQDKSMRQLAKEKAELASDDDVALAWEEEAEFYASLRADVTQDEGSYSSFLDRDEWYERDRRAVTERNKKKYGSLFNDEEK